MVGKFECPSPALDVHGVTEFLSYEDVLCRATFLFAVAKARWDVLVRCCVCIIDPASAWA